MRRPEDALLRRVLLLTILGVAFRSTADTDRATLETVARRTLFALVGACLASGFGVGVARGAETDASPASAPSAPVLAVGAGILPTQWFWPLDKFDEWMQRVIFSFGVREFRAGTSLLQAAERVAELEALEAEGARTPRVTRAHLSEIADHLISAVSITRGLFARHARPMALTVGVVRTESAILDALEQLPKDIVNFPELDDEEFTENGEFSEEERHDPAAFLAIIEERTDAALLSGGVLPSQALRLVMEEKLSRAGRDLKDIRLRQRSLSDNRVLVIAGQELSRVAEGMFSEARLFAAAQEYEEALAWLGEFRRVARWIQTDQGTFAYGALADRFVVASRVEDTLSRLTRLGLLVDEDIATARARAQEALAAVERREGEVAGAVTAEP